MRKPTVKAYEPNEFAIDRITHLCGLVAGGFGIFALIGTALHRLERAG